MAKGEITLKISRYIPGKNQEAFLQEYKVPTSEGMMVLDALNYVREELDPSLAFRWSCRMGICGSCGMSVDGKPSLTCQDLINDHGNNELIVAPLSNFPVIRDLVVDLTDFMEKLKKVKPWIIRDEHRPLSEGEYVQSPSQLMAFRDHSGCINCMLCYSACPIYGLDTHFIGPAAIALAYRYNLDSRDEGQKIRQPILSSPEGVWDCTFVGECTEVCPQGVMPAEAIQRSKLQFAKDMAFKTLMPWGQR